MSQSNNPFMRGFQALSIQRLLAISTEPGTPLQYLPLHPSQNDLQDSQVLQRPVVFGEQFALKADEPYSPSTLLGDCPSVGWVQTVVHALLNKENGKAVHICDTYSREAAESLARRISSKTATNTHCWEISTAHLCERSLWYLSELIKFPSKLPPLIDVFRAPAGNAIGVQLVNSPWSDQHLTFAAGKSLQTLQDEHQQAGVPSMLLNVLQLAGQSDVHFLFFDPDGLILDGLPVYSDDAASSGQAELV